MTEPSSKALIAALVMAGVVACAAAAPAREVVEFSTYLGGAAKDQIRDIATDAAGNIYVTGGTSSPDFPTTPGAFDTTFNTGGALLTDVFVTKLDSKGAVLWSTFIGGPNYDRAYAIEVDSRGFVYIAGRAGAGFPVTPGAFQVGFQGGQKTPLYGPQDGFVCKVTPDGSSLVFCSYFGTTDGNAIRDLAIDRKGDIYIAATRTSGSFPREWFRGAFQELSQGGDDGVVAKIASDGSQVLWATYLGGSGNDSPTPSIRVDAAGNPYVLLGTTSPDMPTSDGAYDRTYNGGSDLYVAKLSSDGSRLVYGTYLGGSRGESSETHGLALGPNGTAYVAATTISADFPTTAQVFQPVYGGSGGFGSGARTNYAGDILVAKLSPDGTRLLASTFLGGRVGEGAEGIAVDRRGNVYLSGASFSENFPATADAFQARNAGATDVVAVELSSDLRRLRYATVAGGSREDNGRTLTVDWRGDFYVAGETMSPNLPTRLARQLELRGNTDGFVMKIRGAHQRRPGPRWIPHAPSGTPVRETGGGK